VGSAVMVVEDEPLMAEDLADALSKMGYEVSDVVSSALQCIASAEQRRPDLVLMDINLGGELDGIDAAQMLRDRFAIPVVFLSGFADERTVSRAKLAGAMGYLLKPFRWSELKSAVEVGLFRHQLERQLRDRERWLATTLRAIGDAAIVVDPEGRVTFMNSAAEELLAEGEAGLRGQTLASRVRLINENTRAPVPHPLQQALSSGEVVRAPRNTALVTADRELPVEYTLAPIQDGQGTISGAVAVIKSLTAQRQAQQQIAVSDRLASLGVVAAGIAHEINNPLTYVLGNLEFLKEEIEHLTALAESDNPAPRKASLNAMNALLLDVQQGARHVARIVGDLGVFARHDAGSKVCDVTERMEWALRVSNSAIVRQARIIRRFRPIPKAGVDEGRLGQVFLNLLLNAAYAMRATNRATNELTVTLEPDAVVAGGHGQFIRIAIADTGSGMTEDVLRRIFEPFFTTKPAGDGSGLGLAVCRGLLTEMGGDISVTSAAGKGTCFIVRVPAASEGATSEEPAGPEPTGSRARILVIDDDPTVLRVLRRMLGASHDVVTSRQAEHALRLIREQPEFDVIVCDVIMPEMDGVAFHREVSAKWPELAARIVFLSGGALAERGGEFFSSIPNAVLQKPPDATQLSRAIEHQLTASGRAGRKASR
jgi:two-component system, cell cycle sensor histidine kinase and response regulator CckA